MSQLRSNPETKWLSESGVFPPLLFSSRHGKIPGDHEKSLWKFNYQFTSVNKRSSFILFFLFLWNEICSQGINGFEILLLLWKLQPFYHDTSRQYFLHSYLSLNLKISPGLWVIDKNLSKFNQWNSHTILERTWLYSFDVLPKKRKIYTPVRFNMPFLKSIRIGWKLFWRVLEDYKCFKWQLLIKVINNKSL